MSETDATASRADHDLDAAALFAALERINERPALYSRYTADALWTSPDISEMLLRFHLDGEVDVASRRTDFIEASVDWMVATFDLGPGQPRHRPRLRAGALHQPPGSHAAPASRAWTSRPAPSSTRARTPSGRAWRSSTCSATTWPSTSSRAYDLAIMIMCDYCALSPSQRRRLLERVGHILAPGGAFLFDVYSLAAFETWEEQVAYGPGLMDGFWSARPYHGFLNTFRYEAEKVVLEKYTIVEAAGSREYLNWFAHYDVAGLTAEVEAAGLTVSAVHGDVAGAPFEASAPEFAVVAAADGASPGPACPGRSCPGWSESPYRLRRHDARVPPWTTSHASGPTSRADQWIACRSSPSSCSSRPGRQASTTTTTSRMPGAWRRPRCAWPTTSASTAS